MLQTLLLVVHLVVCVVLVVVILLQAGKGSGLAAGFGGAGGGTQVFGSQGAGGFLTKATVVVAAIFMSTSLGLAYLSSQPTGLMPTTASPSQPSQQAQGEEIVGGAAAPADEPEEAPAEQAAPAEEAQPEQGAAPAQQDAPSDQDAPAQDSAPADNPEAGDE